MKNYEIRTKSWIVAPKGEAMFSELATVVSIEDEAAGEFVTVTQHGRTDVGKVCINPDEWVTLRDAITAAICACRGDI